MVNRVVERTGRLARQIVFGVFPVSGCGVWHARGETLS